MINIEQPMIMPTSELNQIFEKKVELYNFLSRDRFLPNPSTRACSLEYLTRVLNNNPDVFVLWRNLPNFSIYFFPRRNQQLNTLHEYLVALLARLNLPALGFDDEIARADWLWYAGVIVNIEKEDPMGLLNRYVGPEYQIDKTPIMLNKSDYMALKAMPKLRATSRMVTRTSEDYSRYRRSRVIQDMGNNRRREDLLRLAMEEKSNVALEKIDQIQKATSCLLASQAMTQAQTVRAPKFPPVLFKTMDGIKMANEDCSPKPVRFKTVHDFQGDENGASSDTKSTKSRESQAHDSSDSSVHLGMSSGSSLNASRNWIDTKSHVPIPIFNAMCANTAKPNMNGAEKRQEMMLLDVDKPEQNNPNVARKPQLLETKNKNTNESEAKETKSKTAREGEKGLSSQSIVLTPGPEKKKLKLKNKEVPVNSENLMILDDDDETEKKDSQIQGNISSSAINLNISS